MKKRALTVSVVAALGCVGCAPTVSVDGGSGLGPGLRTTSSSTAWSTAMSGGAPSSTSTSSGGGGAGGGGAPVTTSSGVGGAGGASSSSSSSAASSGAGGASSSSSSSSGGATSAGGGGAGGASPVCPGEHGALCDGVCVDLWTDMLNCWQCGYACPTSDLGWFCAGGNCQFDCGIAGGYTKCGGTCCPPEKPWCTANGCAAN